jgi:hypothetical protein
MMPFHMDHHNTKQQLKCISNESSKLIMSTFKIDNIVYVEDFMAADGYNRDGPKSEIWDLYVAVIEDSKYKLYNYSEHFFWAHCTVSPFTYELENIVDFPLTLEGKNDLSEFIKKIRRQHNYVDDEDAQELGGQEES